MRIVFMGTPDFAVQSLNALVTAGHDVAAVITQPDRPKGRGNKLAFPEVKTRALELGLPVHQPLKVKDESFLELLRGYAPDVIVVVAYGRILPESVLELRALWLHQRAWFFAAGLSGRGADSAGGV